VRNYLPWVTCTSISLASTCAPPTPAFPQPNLIVRDANTGCAYTAQQVYQYLLYAPELCAADNPGNPCLSSSAAAVVSATNPSPSSSGWLNVAQETQHIYHADTTPQACYASGYYPPPGSSPPPPFKNVVAWARSPEWLGSPGPDDSYIGGAIPKAQLTSMAGDNTGYPVGTYCQASPSTDGCVIQFQFQLPNTPNTPCAAGGGCTLSSGVDLRYMSLTFWYSGASGGSPEFYVEGPDGIDAATPCTRNCSLISLSDAAFAVTPFGGKNYASLLVKVSAPSTPLPYPLQLASQTACTSLPLGATANCGVIQGVWPVANTSGGYSVWTANGYTVLDLTQLNGFQSLCPGSGQSCLPLYLTVRNTLPGSGFPCSGAAVPFNTAEYTNEDGDGGGLMGPPCTPPRRSQCRPGRWCRTGYLRNPALLRRRGWRHRSRPRNCAAPSRRTYSA
jgi:hypothetical protein